MSPESINALALSPNTVTLAVAAGFVSQEVVDHLSSDMDVLRGSALLKTFAESFCGQGRPMQLGYIRNGAAQAVDGVFRWRP